jgi:hypothetical protein
MLKKMPSKKYSKRYQIETERLQIDFPVKGSMVHVLNVYQNQSSGQSMFIERNQDLKRAFGCGRIEFIDIQSRAGAFEEIL